MQEALAGLVERGYVARHPRRPGQKEDRYEQLLGGFGEGAEPLPPAADEGSTAPGASATAPDSPAAVPTSDDGGLVPAEDRLTRVERELAELRSELASLREALGEG